jgi:hypothetical protein
MIAVPGVAMSTAAWIDFSGSDSDPDPVLLPVGET